MTHFIHRYRPVFLVLAGAFMISFSGVFVKISDVSPTSSGFYRVLFGFFFLALACMVKNEKIRTNPGKLTLICFCGLTFALDLFFWHASIMFIGPGLATLISNFQVFFLSGIAIFTLGEKARPRFLFAIPLAISGLMLIVGIHWNQLDTPFRMGIFFGLLTAVCYTAFLLSLRKIQADGARSPLISLTAVTFFSAIFLGLKMGYDGDSLVIPNMKSLAALLSLGLFCQTIGWLLITSALPKIQASFTGLILLLQPALAFMWDVAFFHRPTDLTNWFGVVLTLVAIYMGLTGKKQGASQES